MLARSSSRSGYTLLELMVVVIIIAVVSALAVPGILETMRENRVFQGASDVTRMFRQARLEAVSRGTAVAIRWTSGTGEGRFEMYRSTVSSCTQTAWMTLPPNPTAGTLFTTLDFAQSPWQVPPSVDIRVQYCPGIDASKACGTPDNGPMWICYSPSGRVRYRSGDTGPFLETLTGAINGWPFRVARRDGTGGPETGVARVAFVPFGGGTARVQQ